VFTKTEAEILQNYYPAKSSTTFNRGESSTITENSTSTKITSENGIDKTASEGRSSSTLTSSSILGPAYRRIVTRDFMRALVTDSLRSGHPTSEVHSETDLGETIEVRTLSSRGESQDRTIHLNIESDVPEVIITEENHLQFSLQKVIDNAIKFTESGSITINVKLGRTSPMVEIWVIDTGCGIAEESRSSLFTPHFQEDASISRSKDGLGLSLFNAKAHVRKNLGGDVTLERSATEGPSRGSEFLIRLPISAPRAGRTDTPLVGTPTPSGLNRKGAWCDPATSSSYFLPESIPGFLGTPRRPSPSRQTSQKHIAFNPKLAKDYPLNILIAEDNAINRNVAVGSLNKLGYSKENITLAFDGVEAVQQYKASLGKPKDQRFDAILMDIWMPNMDGYEATTRIVDLAKENQELTTIIAVTADVTRESTEKAKDCGMHGWLAKPYKVLDIQKLILEHFGKEEGC
jgi:CheY-like chemotaxis protein